MIGTVLRSCRNSAFLAKISILASQDSVSTHRFFSAHLAHGHPEKSSNFARNKRHFCVTAKNSQENVELSEINYATKMKALRADQLRFEPTHHKIAKVALPRNYKQTGVPFEELEAFRVEISSQPRENYKEKWLTATRCTLADCSNSWMSLPSESPTTGVKTAISIPTSR